MPTVSWLEGRTPQCGLEAHWDRAGYEKDRAMQEDIRYSEGRPVERMSVRDTSSTDGLVHLTVSSVCLVE